MLFTHFIPDQNKHMQLVKPPTCIPTLTQIWSNVPHISAWRATEDRKHLLGCFSPATLGREGRKQTSTSLPLCQDNSKRWRRTGKVTSLLSSPVGDGYVLLLLLFFRNISNHSFREGEKERKKNHPAIPGLSPWKQLSPWPAQPAELSVWLIRDFSAFNGKTHQWWFKNYPAV